VNTEQGITKKISSASFSKEYSISNQIIFNNPNHSNKIDDLDDQNG